MSLLFLYSLFAIIAIAANVLSQEFALLFYQGRNELLIAIPAGTVVGLLVKFVLDRKYIFKADSVPLSKDGRQFIAYAGTGLLTTLLFWGSEIAFELLFASREARYIGAILGLSCGYFLKFQLDRRFVFSGIRQA